VTNGDEARHSGRITRYILFLIYFGSDFRITRYTLLVS
jgi:hypothetical protein